MKSRKSGAFNNCAVACVAVMLCSAGFASGGSPAAKTPAIAGVPETRLMGKLITKPQELPYSFIDRSPLYCRGELTIEEWLEGQLRVRWRSVPIPRINIGGSVQFKPDADWFIYSAPYAAGFVVIYGASLEKGWVNTAFFTAERTKAKTVSASEAERLRNVLLRHVSAAGVSEGVTVSITCEKPVRPAPSSDPNPGGVSHE